jgi:hypothetical protein
MIDEARLLFGRGAGYDQLSKVSVISEARSGTLIVSPVSRVRRRSCSTRLLMASYQQTTMNQERELRAAAVAWAARSWLIFTDQGISGAKGHDQRLQFDALSKAATRREFEIVMAWSVDRLRRSVTDLFAISSPKLLFRSTCTCIPKGSTLRRPWVRPCFRLRASLRNSSARS